MLRHCVGPLGPSYRWVVCGLLLSLTGGLQAAEPTSEQRAFFEKEVRPLLVERCQKCHGDQKQSGGLRLDNIASIQAGGESGSAVVPGKPQESLLIEAINYASLEMPPSGKLEDKEIATLTRWVELGAPWPSGEIVKKAKPARNGTITDEDRQWWAFQPVHKVAPPTPPGQPWGTGVIDQFVLDKLRQGGLEPAPEADRASLIRRLSYDLIGLPPTADEVREFVNDPSPDAYEKVVDRLLSSDRYGERWARHWLDLVRYADSDGYRIDDYRPTAFRYRDYVIRSFNEDKPYDRFVQEQLAGDELFPEDPAARVATGYLRHWIYEYNSRDARGQWQLILDDITDTTGDVFLGLGIQCAHCHDHKFDPILQKDYYRLQGFFAGIMPQDDVIAVTKIERQAHAESMKTWEAKTEKIRAEIDALEKNYREKAERGAVGKFPDDVQAMILKPEEVKQPYEAQVAALAFRQVYYEWNRLETKIKGDDKEKLVELKKKLAEFDKFKPEPLPTALGVTDLGPDAAEVVIPKKGKQLIEPGFLTILDPEPAKIEPIPGNSQTTGRRSALAKWLTQSDNPLTARVIVNRIWQQHFGRGLAANASDFGHLGETPTHPELLDHLAAQFMEDGWHMKALHRRIVMSAAYCQSASHPQMKTGLLKDPENRLYWRGNVRRLDAEQIRDSLYAVTGELDLDVKGGPGVPNEAPRRSIYLRVMRNSRNPVLEAFDAPFWMSSAASRHTTTSPIQSLLLINSQFMLKRGESLAKRLNSAASADDSERIKTLYSWLFGRESNQAEIRAGLEFLATQEKRIDAEEAGSTEAAFLYDKIPFRDGQAAIVSSAQPPLAVQGAMKIPPKQFTIEAYFVLRSIYDSGAVRVVAGNWSGSKQDPGWLFGVTGKGSRRKPQTLVMQMFGKDAAGNLAEGVCFSDHQIQLNKPYYAAAAVTMADESTPGRVMFFVKDLSNDDEPLLTADVQHELIGGLEENTDLTIGGRNARFDSRFDGLVDDVRLSNSALGLGQLLYTSEGTNQHTIGYWRFEAKPDVFADSSGHGLSLKATGGRGPVNVDRRKQAWLDLCHVLLNSNEFLYVR